MEYLLPAKTALKQFQSVQFVRNDDVWMGIEQGADQTMPCPRITDEHAVGSDIAKEFGASPTLQQRSSVQAGQVKFFSN